MSTTVVGLLAFGLAHDSATENWAPDVHGSAEQQVRQIDHAYGFGGALGKLTLRQLMTLSSPGIKTVEVFNFTDTPVAPTAVERLIVYDTSLADTGSRWELPLNYHNRDGSDQKIITTAEVALRRAAVYDLVLLPAGTTPPAQAMSSSSETSFHDFGDPAGDQVISVVYQPTDAIGRPRSFLTGGDGMEVEMLQAFDDVITAVPSPAYGQVQITRLGHETFANTMADTELAALTHTPYLLYARQQPANFGTVPISAAGGTYDITEFAISAGQYHQAQLALVD